MDLIKVCGKINFLKIKIGNVSCKYLQLFVRF